MHARWSVMTFDYRLQRLTRKDVKLPTLLTFWFRALHCERKRFRDDRKLVYGARMLDRKQ